MDFKFLYFLFILIFTEVDSNLNSSHELITTTKTTTTTTTTTATTTTPENADDYEYDNDNSDNDTIVSKEHDSLLKLQNFVSNAVEMALGPSLPMLIQSGLETNASSLCLNAFLVFIREIREKKQWAWRMLDSSGKVASGMLQGTLTDMGSFDQCLEINTRSVEKFDPQYCILDLKPDFDKDIPLDAAILANISEDSFYNDPALRILLSAKDTLPFRIGICIPSTCSTGDLNELINYFTKTAGFKAEVHNCQIHESTEINKIQIVILSIFVCIAMLTIIGTVIDIFSRDKSNQDIDKSEFDDKKSLRNFILLFSFIKNHKYFLSSSRKLNSSPFQHLDGIRSISMVLIIVGHSYFDPDSVDNHFYRGLLNIRKIDDNIIFIPFANSFSVNSFFFISGLLLVHSNWKRLMLNNGKINVMKFFVHRILRIWPMYLMLIGIALILPLLGSGPLWPESVGNHAKLCEQSWYTNILFYNNFVHQEKLCLHHTWFLATLMQLYMVAFFILFFLYRYPITTIIVMIVATILSSVGVYFYTVHINLRIPTIIAYDVFFDRERKFIALYFMPFIHLGSYFCGIIFGYYFVKYKSVTISRKNLIIAWSASVLTLIVVKYAPTNAFKGQTLTVEETGLYLAISRTVWSIAIGWIVFACSTGRGGILNKFLSWKFFGLLNSLGFLAYLIHPLLMVIHRGSIRERVYYGHYEIMNIFIARLVLTYAISYVIFVIVEVPFSSIENYLFSIGGKSGTMVVNGKQNLNGNEMKVTKSYYNNQEAAIQQ